MRKNIILPILICAFFAFGCGLSDKFKSATSNSNVVSVAAPQPSVSATPTAAPSASPDDKQTTLGRNLLAFGSGEIIASVSSEAPPSDGKARHLIDEAEFAGWKTADGQIENQTVVLELPARTTLKTIVFDTNNLAFAPVAPKDVKIEVSDVSASDGFQEILEATLALTKDQGGVDNQMFPVTQPIAGRFVRYTVKNNAGSPKAIFTKELRGYGDQEPIPTLENITGSYEFYGGSGYFSGEKMQLKQDGAAIIGCTVSKNFSKTFEGGIEGRIVTLKYYGDDPNKKDSGVMILAPDARNLNFIYWLGDKKLYDSLTPARKTGDQISATCANLPGFNGDKGQDAVKDKLEKNLAEQGRAVLYGINFDFNSDVIKPESKPTLEKVVAILKEKPDWKFSVEGHTDNVGGTEFNQTLSEKRAASVKKYLTDAGVDGGRLSSIGYGLSKPIAPNTSEVERAQNRRVELVKQ